MADLYTESHYGLDISAGGIVLTYTYTGSAPKSVMARVVIGSVATPIAGNGTYTVRATLNGIRLSPDSLVTVAAVSATVLQSREILLRNGDILQLTVDGDAADVAIDTAAVLVDLTPLTPAEVYGAGSVLVDHNYGGTDNLRYVTDTGAGIDNARILAFLSADYDAGLRSGAYVVGETTTTVDGRWVHPLMLDAGNYTLVYVKQGAFGPDIKLLTVV